MQRAIGVGLTILGLVGAPAWAQVETEVAPAAEAQVVASELVDADAAVTETVLAEPAADASAATETAVAMDMDKERRDPFRPFTLDLRPDITKEDPLTPLQQYELRQLKLTAVLWGLSPPLAMVEDDVGMGYIVSPGTPIGRHGGIVQAIEPGRVMVEESTLDFYGNRQVTRVVLEIPREEDTRTAKREYR